TASGRSRTASSPVERNTCGGRRRLCTVATTPPHRNSPAASTPPSREPPRPQRRAHTQPRAPAPRSPATPPPTPPAPPRATARRHHRPHPPGAARREGKQAAVGQLAAPVGEILPRRVVAAAAAQRRLDLVAGRAQLERPRRRLAGPLHGQAQRRRRRPRRGAL